MARSPSINSRLLAALLALSTLLGGCGTLFYERTGTGAFKGQLDVQWIAPNRFIYRVNQANPLTFTTAEGHVIRPRTMYTDAGSIPRLFWSAPSLGPWDFAPGYIIHDWLFEQHHCKEGDWVGYDFERTAVVLAQAIKTQMAKANDPEPAILYAIYQAVKSPAAKVIWDRGTCDKPPGDAELFGRSGPAPVTLKSISFD